MSRENLEKMAEIARNNMSKEFDYKSLSEQARDAGIISGSKKLNVFNFYFRAYTLGFPGRKLGEFQEFYYLSRKSKETYAWKRAMGWKIPLEC